MTGEEELTALMTELFDWIEQQQPEYLIYKNSCLRGAFERYFYFEATARPYNLLPLLKFTKPWRDSAEESDLTKTFDHYWKKSSEITFIKKLVATPLPWLRLGRDFYRSIISNISPASSERSYVKSPFGLFAINCRFVDFFQPLVSEFKSSRCIFFSSHPLLIAEKVKEQQAGLASLPMPKGFTSGLKLSVWHPLFPVYLRLCMFYQQAYIALQQERPEVLLFAEGTSHYDELMARAAKKHDISTIRIQSGRAGVLHSGYRNMCFDAMVCWSNDFVERYQSVSPKSAYYAIGSPLMDEVHLLREKNLVEGTKESVIIFTQPVSKNISNQDYLLLLEIAENLLVRDKGIKLIVRKHPVDQNVGFDILQQKYSQRLYFMNSPAFSLAEALTTSSCSVGFFSTTLSESAACGVLPIILQTNEQQSVYPFPEKHGAAILVHSAEDAIDKIIKFRNQPEDFEAIKAQMTKFSQRFFGPNDGKAKERMFALIKQYSRELSDAQ